MDVQAISGAATVAIVSTLIFLGLSLLGTVGSRLLPAPRFFRDAISRESGHRYRDALQRTERAQRTSIFAILLFSALFVTAYWLNASSLYDAYPEWQLWLLLVAICGAAICMLFRVVSGFFQWRKLCFERDAVIAVGHGLERLSSEHGRVFHDVETSDGGIDHVLVGMRGVYAIHVIAKKAHKNASVSASNGKLTFADDDDVISVASMRRKNQALGKKLSALCDTRINVRLVVGMPGWIVDRQGDQSLLIVNERTLPMIKGWRDTQEFLLNDVVDTIAASIEDMSRPD